MNFKFHGVDFRYIRSNKLKNLGYCKNPKTPTKDKRIISVSSKLEGKKELEINIHEFLHACGWFADEEWIVDSAKDIAEALWELGYRKTNESEKTEKGNQ